MEVYVIWGLVTVAALIWSIVEFISYKKKEILTGTPVKKTPVIICVLLLSISSMAVLLLAGVVLLEIMFAFTSGEIKDGLEAILILWPVISAVLIVISVNYKIESFAQPKEKKKAKTLLVIAIISIVLYLIYCCGLWGYVMRLKNDL